MGSKNDTVLNVARNKNDKNSEINCFFVKGQGASGKLLLYETIYYVLRYENIKVSLMASTGILSI